MRFKHDPLRPHPRRKKKNETPDETERRLSADLRLLMTDERYQKNDPDYRHFVQRQYRRVYDDPSGEPREGLRIGRPDVFVTDLEPFDRDRERRIRRGEEVERPVTPSSDVTRARRTRQRGSGDGASLDDGTGQLRQRKVAAEAAQAQPDTDADETGLKQERQIFPRGPQAGSAKAEREQRIRHVAEGVEGLLRAGERRGLTMAVKYLRRYLDGVGGVVGLDWSTVRDHGPAATAEVEVRSLFTDWLVGLEEDKSIGAPFMELADGEVLEIGKPREGSSVWWSRTFDRDLINQENLDSSLVFGTGQIKGYGQLQFERQGDEIHVSGVVSFELDEPYDFEGVGFTAMFVSTFFSDGPTITNINLKSLARLGPAAEFKLRSRHLAELIGTIVLRDGVPAPELSTFTWRDLDRHHS